MRLLLAPSQRTRIALRVESALAGWTRPLEGRGQSYLAPVLPVDEWHTINTRYRRASVVWLLTGTSCLFATSKRDGSRSRFLAAFPKPDIPMAAKTSISAIPLLVVAGESWQGVRLDRWQRSSTTISCTPTTPCNYRW